MAAELGGRQLGKRKQDLIYEIVRRRRPSPMIIPAKLAVKALSAACTNKMTIANWDRA